MLEKLLNQLGEDLDMKEDITVKEKNHYLISFDSELQVEALESGKNYLFKGNIGASPQKNEEAFLMQVIEANLFGLGTRNAVIGLNEDGKVLTLSQEVDYNCPFKDFKEKLEDFISVLEFWRKAASQHV